MEQFSYYWNSSISHNSRFKSVSRYPNDSSDMSQFLFFCQRLRSHKNSRYSVIHKGRARRLTINHGLERPWTRLLLHCSDSLKAVSAIAEAVYCEFLISTSIMIGAGLKKSIMTKFCGSFNTLSILFKSNEEVFVTKIISAARSDSSSHNTVRLIARSSMISSITSFVRERSSIVFCRIKFPRISPFFSAVTFSFFTERGRCFAMFSSTISNYC